MRRRRGRERDIVVDKVVSTVEGSESKRSHSFFKRKKAVPMGKGVHMAFVGCMSAAMMIMVVGLCFVLVMVASVKGENQSRLDSLTSEEVGSFVSWLSKEEGRYSSGIDAARRAWSRGRLSSGELDRLEKANYARSEELESEIAEFVKVESHAERCGLVIGDCKREVEDFDVGASGSPLRDVKLEGEFAKDGIEFDSSPYRLNSKGELKSKFSGLDAKAESYWNYSVKAVEAAGGIMLCSTLVLAIWDGRRRSANKR